MDVIGKILQDLLQFGEIWTEYCRVCGAPADGEWFADVKKYEAEVLSKRN